MGRLLFTYSSVTSQALMKKGLYPQPEEANGKQVSSKLTLERLLCFQVTSSEANETPKHHSSTDHDPHLCQMEILSFHLWVCFMGQVKYHRQILDPNT